MMSNMDKESKHGQKDLNMKAIIIMGKNKEEELIHGKMVQSTKENGWEIK